MRRIAIFFLRLYQLCISPYLPHCCRFYPSCSEYAIEAFRSRPFFLACWLTVCRLTKCGPWHPGGCDLLRELELLPDSDRLRPELVEPNEVIDRTTVAAGE